MRRIEDTMTKTARLEARITPDLHALLKRAADLEGRSVTDFVLGAAQKAAEQRVEQAQVIRLSPADQRSLADAILDPPEPTPALRRAFRRHRELLQPPRSPSDVPEHLRFTARPSGRRPRPGPRRRSGERSQL
jgi:uncharacterized protein (DUF1778 family)